MNGERFLNVKMGMTEYGGNVVCLDVGPTQVFI